MSRFPKNQLPVHEAFNLTLLRKMEWMARQFRNFNDVNSIIHWAGAISSLRDLLLPLPMSSSSGQMSKPLASNYNTTTRQPSMIKQHHSQSHSDNNEPFPTKRPTHLVNRTKALKIPLISTNPSTLP